MGEKSLDGKNYDQYNVEISTTHFIDALSADEEVTAKEVDDCKIILKDAVITANFFVDKKAGYIGKLEVSAKNLTQISVPEAEESGLRSIHDSELTATLSRFNLPTEITAPDPKDVISKEEAGL